MSHETMKWWRDSDITMVCAVNLIRSTGRSPKLVSATVPWSIAVVLVLQCFLIAIAHCDELAGQRIYRQGLGIDGSPLSATTQSDILVSGSRFSCITCHRRSGYGSSEGGVFVLPVTGRFLFSPRRWERSFLFRKLFKESQPRKFWSQVRQPRSRPAYSEESLAKAIRNGIDPAGRKLDAMMPRYRMDDDDMSHLIAYLRTLSLQTSPGVDDDNVYFATIVSDQAHDHRVDAMLATMASFFNWMNQDTRGDLHNPNFSPNYRSDLIAGYRFWHLDVWRLRGDASSWPRQLEEHYRKRPVFVVISGMTGEDWTPVHQFCEKNELPCLFPNTDLPDISDPCYYTVYLDRGVAIEAEALAVYLQDYLQTPARIVQLADAGIRGQLPAKLFRQKLARSSDLQVEQYDAAGAAGLRDHLEALATRQPTPTHLVIWPGRQVAMLLEWLKDHPQVADEIYLPSVTLEQLPNGLSVQLLERLFFTYPYELPGAYHPRAFRVRAWMNSRGVVLDAPRVQLNTYYALTTAQFALESIVDQFSRDYFLEFIEHEAENALNPGTYPRMGLGPGQRFASKGAYIVRVDPGLAQPVVAASDWILP